MGRGSFEPRWILCKSGRLPASSGQLETIHHRLLHVSDGYSQAGRLVLHTDLVYTMGNSAQRVGMMLRVPLPCKPGLAFQEVRRFVHWHVCTTDFNWQQVQEEEHDQEQEQKLAPQHS